MQRAHHSLIREPTLMTETKTKQSGPILPLTNFAMKIRTRFGCWNIRTMLESTRLAQINKEMHNYKLSVLGLSEIRWNGSGEYTLKDGELLLYVGKPTTAQTSGVGLLLNKETRKGLLSWIPVSSRIIVARLKTRCRNTTIVQCYAPTEVATGQEKDDFYDQLRATLQAINKGDVVILMGDFNAKLGTNNIGLEKIMGCHGIGTINDNGLRFSELCSEHNLVIGGTLFPHKTCHKITWVSPDGITKNQIDHIAISRTWRGSLLDVRNKRGADVATDHYLLIGEVKMKVAVAKSRYVSTCKKLNTSMLSDVKKQKLYSQELNNHIQHLNYAEDDSIDVKWNAVKSIFIKAGERTLGYKHYQRKEWISDTTWTKIEERKTTRGKELAAKTLTEQENWRTAYRELDKDVKRSARNDKRRWIQGLAEQAQVASETHNSRVLYQITKRLAGRTFNSEHAVKSKTGKLLVGLDEQMNRWKQHFQEILNSEDLPIPCGNPVVPRTPKLKINTDTPTDAEIRAAVNKLKSRKAAGTDNIPAELLKADIKTTIKLLHPIISDSWTQEKVPMEWCEGLIIKLHKKGDKADCNNYRGITLLNVASKVLSLILLSRLSEAIEPSIREEQAGFRPNRSCIDQINSIRLIMEQSTEWRSPTYMLFVDFEKAFDRLNRDKMWEILAAKGVPQKIINIIGALYLNSTSRVKHRGRISDHFPVSAGVRQGCVLSPLLFIIVMDFIMETVNLLPRGIRWQINNRLEDLDYADDLCLLAHTQSDMQHKLESLSTEAKKSGLTINLQKTKEMRICSTSQRPLVLNGEIIENTSNFCYLGSMIATEDGANVDVENRIKKAYQAFGSLNRFWNRREISRRTKLCVFNTNVKSVLLYACETWKETSTITAKLQTFINKCLRRILRIHWPETISNRELLQITNQKEVAREIKERKWRWIGHTLRKGSSSIPAQAIDWNPQGSRRVGRPKGTWRRTVENEARQQGKTWKETKHLAANRTRWKCFVEALCSS